jgi:DNA-binding transcriptional MerR regulator
VSTVRYSHQIGVLEPDHVDPATGYRYYHRSQVALAVDIAELRAASLTPHQIGAVIGASPAERRAVLLGVRDEIIRRITAERANLQLVEGLLAPGEPGPHPPGELVGPEPARLVRRVDALVAGASPVGPAPVTMGHLGPNPVMSVEWRVRSWRDLGPGVRRGLATLRRHSGRAPGVYAALLPVDLGTGDDLDIELQLEPSEPAGSAPPAERRPRALRTLHVGAHRDLWTAYDALLDHAARHRLVTGDTITERYLAPSGDQPRTEVLLPVAATS